VSATQVQAQVPPALFQQRTYTFDFQVNPQAAQPIHIKFPANTGKVTFQDQPQYAASHLGGFHQRTTSPAAAPDYFLMVPEQNTTSNSTTAVFQAPVPLFQPANNAPTGPSTTLPLGTSLSFDPSNTSLVNVYPRFTITPSTNLIATGNGADQPSTTNVIANAHLVSVKGPAVVSPIGTLQVQLLKQRKYQVFLHYVPELPGYPQNPAPNSHAACSTLPLQPARVPASAADANNKATVLQTGLNNIWQQQGNVQFIVTPVQGAAGTCQGTFIPEPVDYDLNKDGNLLVVPHINQEINAILAAAGGPKDPPLAAGVLAGIDIYFVQNFLNNLALTAAHRPNLTIGSPFCTTQDNCMAFQFTGGTAPYAWQVMPNSSLPPGLNTMPGGPPANQNSIILFTGTPTQGGVGQVYTYTLQVSDSSQPQQIVQLAVTFSPALAPTLPTFQYKVLAGQGCCVLGFVTKINDKTIFVDQKTGDDRIVHVLAHEIGHALGLNHPSEKQANWGKPGIPASGTCVPFLTQTDSDFSDDNQLMWWETENKVQSHIGIQQWWQLNGFESTACQ
jgi:hypothetical protein